MIHQTAHAIEPNSAKKLLVVVAAIAFLKYCVPLLGQRSELMIYGHGIKFGDSKVGIPFSFELTGIIRGFCYWFH
jgi:hypothetical protein